MIRLRPAPHCRSKIISYSLTIEPANHFINWQQDPFDFFLKPSAEKYPFKYEARLKQELAPCLAAEHLTKRLKACLARIDRRKRRTIDFLVDVNRQVHQNISYLVFRHIWRPDQPGAARGRSLQRPALRTGDCN